MLLELKNTNKENINKLLAFAKQNHLNYLCGTIQADST